MIIGTGNAVLALFAAKTGAKKVYAVEISEVAEDVRLLIQNNGMDHVVNCYLI